MAARTGASEDAPVRVDLLGPLRLVVGGEEIDVPGPKRRALLALLARADGRAVTVDELVADLWPGEQPDGARAGIQSHVSRLRRHLGPSSARLVSTPEGYRLDLGPDGTDVAIVRELVARAATADDRAVALAALADARSRWRGEPLAEFPDVPALAAWGVALAELGRRLDSDHAAAMLDGGAVEEAVEVAARQVAADPLSEAATRTLVRALHRAGRSAEALRAAYEHRARLRREAGLDASPALAALESEVAAASGPTAGRIARSTGRLWGRDAELAALRSLVSTERLVTVLGPGGVGKTRLATELAAAVEPATAVWLEASGDEGVVPALAEALGLTVVQGDVLAACLSLLAAGPRLLLLDGCEHVLGALRRVVSLVLASCPEVTVLATSREPLGVAEEQRLRLGPIEVSRPASVADVSGSPAVALFVERARRVRPRFEPDADDLALVTEIAGRLDGLPLAIELAAGRLSAFGVADLHARLDDALDVIGDGGEDTLRRTIRWSYDLLTPDEQRLLRALSAFPGGMDLPTVEQIGDDLGLSSATAALARLVDASVVEAATEPTVRYQLLETVRAFAREEQDRLDERADADGRFRRWALGLVSRIADAEGVADERLVDAAVRRERANLRAAWRLVRSDPSLDDAVALLVPLDELAGWRDLTEVWDWILELADDPRAAAHGRATTIFGMAAGCAWARGELERASELARRGLEAGGPDTWRCTAALALVALSRGELDRAVELGTDAGKGAPRREQSFGVAALAAAYSGDLELARSLVRRLTDDTSSVTIKAFGWYVLGEVHALDDRLDDASAAYTAAIDSAGSVGATFVEGLAAVGVLSVQVRAGRMADALAGYRDLIEYWARTGGWLQQWTTLRDLALVLASVGDREPALFLAGAAAVAPDASPPPAAAAGLDRDATDDWAAAVRARGAAATRAEVLHVARAAIDARLAAMTAGP